MQCIKLDHFSFHYEYLFSIVNIFRWLFGNSTENNVLLADLNKLSGVIMENIYNAWMNSSLKK